MAFQKLAIKNQRGFTLVDLIVSVLISGILLAGIYKSFLANVTENVKALDVTLLDDKTRKIVKLMQDDISDVNGNIINGVPTVFPNFNESTGETNGFVLFKALKSFPVMEMSQATFEPPLGADQIPLDLTSTAVDPSGLAINKVKEGMFAILYNFENYSWIPYRIAGNPAALLSGAPGDYKISLNIKKYSDTNGWFSYLATQPCTDYRPPARKGDAPEKQVCIDSGGSSVYQDSNTAFIIAETVEYVVEDEKLYRITNSIYSAEAGGTNPNKTLIADKVSAFEPTFKMKQNIIYSQERPTIRNISDIQGFIRNLVPGNSNRIDDCTLFINYYCYKTDSNRELATLAYAYTSTQISGIDITLKVKTETKDKNKIVTEKSKKLSLYFTLDENIGNAALNTFNPVKIIASKDRNTRPFGAMMATPAIYGDPNGGSLAPFYTAVAPMVDVVHRNEDDVNDDQAFNLCSYCNDVLKDCSGYPPICSADLNKDNTKDYLQCQAAVTPEERYQLGCFNPAGSLVDRGLNNSPDTSLNNQTNPQLVFMDNLGSIKFKYDLSKSCTGNCPLRDSWYQKSAYFQTNADTVFPLTAFPFMDDSGNLKRIYLGTARLRMPDESDASKRYYPYYHSSVFSINPEDHTSTLLWDKPQTPSFLIEKAYGDIASVSQLEIRKEYEDNQWWHKMYMSSQEANRIVFRKRLSTSESDADWSDPTLAFEDKKEDPYRVKFSMLAPWFTGEDQIKTYPFTDLFMTSSPTKEYPRIAAMHAHPDGKIYFCTTQMSPDQEIDHNGYFYNNEITYNTPVMHEDGTRYVCDPHPDCIGDDCDDNPGCTIQAGVPKPIAWKLCSLGEHKAGCWDKPASQRPYASELRPDFSATIKVAMKKPDGSWQLEIIARTHGRCTGITSDTNGDLLVSSPLNVMSLPYSKVNGIISGLEAIPKIDLMHKDSTKVFYVADNELNEFASTLPDSPTDTIALTKLSGIRVYPHHNRLNLAFTDAINKTRGYIVAAKNPYKNMLFVQILNDENTDLNQSKIAVFAKGKVDRGAEFEWLLPFKHSKVWANIQQISEFREALAPASPPIHIRPPIELVNHADPTFPGGLYIRELSKNQYQCTYSPDDQYVCPGEGASDTCTKDIAYCGQSLHLRQCSADIIENATQGAQSGNPLGYYGCGVTYPTPQQDPSMLPPAEGNEEIPHPNFP